jgi:molybdate transport system substrate-binding protein
MRVWAWLFLLVGLVVSTASMARGRILVSAASSLREALTELAGIYQSPSRGDLFDFNWGASGALAAQIELGAGADLFLSASAEDVDRLARRGLIVESTRVVFAANRLVIVTPSRESPYLKTFADLGSPDIRHLAIGNPGTVPVGRYAEKLLRETRLWKRLRARLVFGETARQVVDYVARGEVDAGIVYASDAMLAKNRLRVIEIDSRSQPRIEYVGSVIASSRHAPEGREFLRFIADEGREVFGRWGFESRVREK